MSSHLRTGANVYPRNGEVIVKIYRLNVVFVIARCKAYI